MKSFNVIITRDTTESVSIAVSAENKDEAQQQAIDLALNGNLYWVQDDTPNASSDPYITDVEEVDETELIEYQLTAAFDVSCYIEKTILATSPEHAIEQLKELYKDDELFEYWDVDYASADQHRIISFLDPSQNPIICEDLYIASEDGKEMFG